MGVLSKKQEYVLTIGYFIYRVFKPILYYEQADFNRSWNFYIFEWVLTMQLGQMLSYFFFLVYKSKFPSKYSKERQAALLVGKKANINIGLFALIAFFETLSTFLFFMAMMSLSLSTVCILYYSMNNFLSAIVQSAIQNRNMHNQNRLGIFINAMGYIFLCVTVAVDGTQIFYHVSLDADYYFDYGSQISFGYGPVGQGIILTFFASVAYSIQLGIETKFINKYFLNPYQCAGIKGTWGFVFTLTAMISVLIGGYYPSFYYFSDLFSYRNGLFTLFAFLDFFMSLSAVGVYDVALKHLSTLSFDNLGAATPLFIWMFTLALGELFHWYQMLGYFMIVTGVFLFKERVIIPYGGLDKQLMFKNT